MNSLSNTIDPKRLQDEHEVGHVYRAIDTMQRNIRKDFQTILEAEEELEKYKSNLEKLVQERTEKLNQREHYAFLDVLGGLTAPAT
jgi:DNA replication initiation complex subunit (GINS family)